MENNHKHNIVWAIGLIIILILGIWVGVSFSSVNRVSADQMQGSVIDAESSGELGDNTNEQAKISTNDIEIKLNATDTTPAGYVIAGTFNASQMALFIKSKKIQNPITLNSMSFGTINGSGIDHVDLYDVSSGAVVATATPSMGKIEFTGLSNVYSSQSGLMVKMFYKNVGVGAALTGIKTRIFLTQVGYTTSSGNSKIFTPVKPIYDTVHYPVASLIKVDKLPITPSGLQVGLNTVAQFTVSLQGSLGSSSSMVKRVSFSYFNVPDFNIDTFKLYYDSGDIAGGKATITELTSVNGIIDYEFNQAQIIAAGSPVTFTAKANIVGYIGAGESLSIDILKTNAYKYPWSYGAIKSNITSPNGIIWSDMSALNHSLSTKDWFGDYYVPVLPIDEWTISQ